MTDTAYRPHGHSRLHLVCVCARVWVLIRWSGSRQTNNRGPVPHPVPTPVQAQSLVTSASVVFSPPAASALHEKQTCTANGRLCVPSRSMRLRRHLSVFIANGHYSKHHQEININIWLSQFNFKYINSPVWPRVQCNLDVSDIKLHVVNPRSVCQQARRLLRSHARGHMAVVFQVWAPHEQNSNPNAIYLTN